ncbi:hypothetical protein [Sinobaca sp. H24]|uniref:hypothetical protein n=1 Tax=Sinobaca sp. H24 TaxID=2923376 RepID=UPI00207A46A3|nr:hypothetical protein [Sinobaca sp. H24]
MKMYSEQTLTANYYILDEELTKKAKRTLGAAPDFFVYTQWDHQGRVSSIGVDSRSTNEVIVQKIKEQQASLRKQKRERSIPS